MPRIHTAPAAKQLLPRHPFVDAGYPSAELLAASQSDSGIDLYGAACPDITWQARDEQAFKLSEFHVDWEKRKVTCPMGKTSLNCISGRGVRGKPYLQARFRKQDCLACGSRTRCTRTKSAPRIITLPPMQEQQVALQAARERQKPKRFWETYSLPSGIEGTVHQAVDKLGMRRSRYRGMAKTRFPHLVTAAVINIQRILSWIVDALVPPRTNLIQLSWQHPEPIRQQHPCYGCPGCESGSSN